MLPFFDLQRNLLPCSYNNPGIIYRVSSQDSSFSSTYGCATISVSSNLSSIMSYKHTAWFSPGKETPIPDRLEGQGFVLLERCHPDVANSCSIFNFTSFTESDIRFRYDSNDSFSWKPSYTPRTSHTGLLSR